MVVMRLIRGGLLVIASALACEVAGQRRGPAGAADGKADMSTTAGGTGADTGAAMTTAGSSDGVGEASTGAQPLPNFALNGPVLLTTSEMLRQAYEHIQAGDEPFVTAWQRVLERAESALGETYEPPYAGGDHEAYFKATRAQAFVVRASAVAYRLTEDRRYLERARSLLLRWAEDGNAYPFSLPKINLSVGLVVGRMAVIFGDAYALLHHALTPAERATVEAWLQRYAEAIAETQQLWIEAGYFNEHDFNNHLGAQMMGLVAIGYATGDDTLVDRALAGPDNPRSFERLFAGVIVMDRGDLFKNDLTLIAGAPDPRPGEIYDRYRVNEGHGLHYSQLHLRLLTLMAVMARNNGWHRDYFAYTGPEGEQLLSSYEFYAPFVVSGRTSERSGYYRDDTGVDFGMQTLLELAHRFYPDEPRFVHALAGRNRVYHDYETFGWTGALLFGMVDVSDRFGTWTFERAGDDEGWAARRDLDMTVANGRLELELTGGDPGIVSPRSLRLPAERFSTLTLRIANESGSEHCQVFFATDEAPGYANDRVVGLAIAAHASESRDYSVAMSTHPQWTGSIESLRIDFDSGTGGRVLVDAITLD